MLCALLNTFPGSIFDLALHVSWCCVQLDGEARGGRSHISHGSGFELRQFSDDQVFLMEVFVSLCSVGFRKVQKTQKQITSSAENVEAVS